jgi:predicted membrane protein
MSLARTVAAILGIIYVLVGVVGFLPDPLVQASTAASATGALLGVFPINPLHNFVHLVIGASLLYASMATATAIMVSRVIGIVYVVVGLLGLVSPNGFGLLPLGGADVFLHLGTGAVLLAVGFMNGGTTRAAA